MLSSAIGRFRIFKEGTAGVVTGIGGVAVPCLSASSPKGQVDHIIGTTSEDGVF